ncbi:creatininase family protein [Bacillus sp. DJP31]|uniref:creatininase family protein n=1 Tax=Bacillus sp. DJP31 TaxID=3409789 RepID=UPI003BB643A2
MYMMDLNMRKFQEQKKHINTVLLPIGMVEAHGPHCSLGTDVLIPREFIKRLNVALDEKIMIAAEIPYGRSFALRPFDGTIDISSETFINYVYEVGQEFYRNGFQNLILFNGHGGNIPSLQIASEKLAELGMVVLTMNWWLDYRNTIVTITPGFGHAGEDETSLILAINEELAETQGLVPNELPAYFNVKYKNWGNDLFPDAYSGNPGESTAAKGEQLYEAIIPLMINDIENLWSISNEQGE